jgi:hypothetical protein
VGNPVEQKNRLNTLLCEGPALTRPTLARGRRASELDPALDRGSEYHVLVAAERVRGWLI